MTSIGENYSLSLMLDMRIYISAANI